MTNPSAPIPHLQLGISTRIPIHPDFIRNAPEFATAHGVNIVGIPRPITTFSRNRDSNERTARSKLNVHLVQHGAIRLFVKRETEGSPWEIMTIDVNPSILLYDDPDHSLIQHDILRCLEMLRREIGPLLADPRDARHIVPGLVEGKIARAYWRNITSSMIFPDLGIENFHNIAHPHAGRAKGSTRKRIQLGKKDDDLIISFEAVKPTSQNEEPRGRRSCLRVSLSLKGPEMIASYGRHGMAISMGNPSTLRLISFHFSDFIAVYQCEMSRLEGIYLPVPEMQPEDGCSATLAWVVDLMKCTMPIPATEIECMAEAIRGSTEHGTKVPDRDARSGTPGLRPIPVGSLLLSAPTSLPRKKLPGSHQIADPDIIATNGSIPEEPGGFQPHQ